MEKEKVKKLKKKRHKQEGGKNTRGKNKHESGSRDREMVGLSGI